MGSRHHPDHQTLPFSKVGEAGIWGRLYSIPHLLHTTLVGVGRGEGKGWPLHLEALLLSLGMQTTLKGTERGWAHREAWHGQESRLYHPEGWCSRLIEPVPPPNTDQIVNHTIWLRVVSGTEVPSAYTLCSEKRWPKQTAFFKIK